MLHRIVLPGSYEIDLWTWIGDMIDTSNWTSLSTIDDWWWLMMIDGNCPVMHGVSMNMYLLDVLKVHVIRPNAF